MFGEKNILLVFVCTGNTCRSVMAEGIFKKISSNRNDIIVASAGTHAIAGMLASDNAVKVLNQMGIDMKDHLATPFDEIIAEKADLIVVMTMEHKDNILTRFAKVQNIEKKTKLLTEYSLNENKLDGISDPIGMGYDYYFSCAQSMLEPLKKLYEAL